MDSKDEEEALARYHERLLAPLERRYAGLLIQLAERFCAAPIPASECADPCASMPNYPSPRTGTNFLSMMGARGVLEHILTKDLQLDFEGWADENGLCLDQIFMSTGGVPSNPYEKKSTRLAYEIWCASRGITV